MWSPLVRRHLSDHLLWSIFQSSLHILYITNHAGPYVWAALMESCLYISFLLFIWLFHFSINSLFNFSIVLPRYCFIFQALTSYCFIFQLLIVIVSFFLAQDSNHRPPDLIHEALVHKTTVSCYYSEFFI